MQRGLENFATEPDLLIVNDLEYATLLTCIPYGVNNHRLLVRGHKIPYEPKEKEKALSMLEDWRVIASIFAILVAVVLLILIKRKKKKIIVKEPCYVIH